MRAVRRTSGLLLLLATGCTSITYELSAPPDQTVDDLSALAPRLKQRAYRQIMVLPPSGSERGQFDTNMAVLERALLSRGLTMIVPAVSARVVFNEEKNAAGVEQRRGGSELSDLERILIMARESRANAVLQIGQFGWEGTSARCFVATRQTPPMREVTVAEHTGWDPAWRWVLEAPLLRFTARLIDVEDGEIVASLAMNGKAVHSLPGTYTARFKPDAEARRLRLISESFPFSQGAWVAEAQQRVTDELFNRVAQVITSGGAAAGAGQPGEEGGEEAPR